MGNRKMREKMKCSLCDHIFDRPPLKVFDHFILHRPFMEPCTLCILGHIFRGFNKSIYWIINPYTHTQPIEDENRTSTTTTITTTTATASRRMMMKNDNSPIIEVFVFFVLLRICCSIRGRKQLIANKQRETKNLKTFLQFHRILQNNSGSLDDSRHLVSYDIRSTKTTRNIPIRIYTTYFI